jgi:hypothetical protein
MSSRGTVFAWVAVANAALLGQAVVSVHSGVINFFEGSVLVDGQKLEPKFGKFYDVKQGSKLWTENGRAEVLLTPGAILRVGEESSVRMSSTALTDTRVEFGGGEVALDSRGAKASGAPLRITYKGYEVSFTKPGVYNLTSAPAELRVHQGEAQVSVNGKSVVVKEGRLLPFSGALAAQNFDADVSREQRVRDGHRRFINRDGFSARDREHLHGYTVVCSGPRQRVGRRIRYGLLRVALLGRRGHLPVRVWSAPLQPLLRSSRIATLAALSRRRSHPQSSAVASCSAAIDAHIPRSNRASPRDPRPRRTSHRAPLRFWRDRVRHSLA